VRHLRRSAEVAERALAGLLAAEQARRAREREATRELAVVKTAAEPAPVEVTPAEPGVAAPRTSGTLVVVATAYCLPGFTATGTPVGPGTVAVDPAVIPLGSTLSIPGYGTAVAADTGPSIRGARIDVWFPTIERAHAWGTRTVEVQITGA
jgi:3D (Asp-Asp-Asp) domain-containing protein